MKTNPGRFFRLLKEALISWRSNHASSVGAGIAYYTVFALVPLLLIVITVVGFLFGSEAARSELLAQLSLLIGEDSARAIEGFLLMAHKPAQGGLALLIGVLLLLFGATSVFAELQKALDRIWEAPESTGSSGLWHLVKTRLLSFGLMLGIAFLLMVSLIVSAALAALSKWWGGYFGNALGMLQVIDVLVSILMITCLFALIYKIMPSVYVAWHEVWIGAAFTTLLFVGGKFLIGLYLGRSSIASGFGAAASIVIILIWVYYSAQIFLLGAEFTHVYSNDLRTRRGRDTAPAD